MTALATFAAWFRIPVPTETSSLPIEIPDVDRNDLAAALHDFGARVGAEIGVEKGYYAEELCKRNPNLKLYAVDAWLAYKGYREHVPQDKVDGLYESAVKRLRPHRCELIRMKSVEASAKFKDRSLDFVYIDANHDLPHVIEDLAAWTPKVKVGGIVAGHDYCRAWQSGYRVHVVEAVKAWTGAYQIKPWFVLGTNELAPSGVREKPRSFCWVVQ